MSTNKKAAETEGKPGLSKATEAARAVGGQLAVAYFGADRAESAKNREQRTAGRHAGGSMSLRQAMLIATLPSNAREALQDALQLAEAATRAMP